MQYGMHMDDLTEALGSDRDRRSRQRRLVAASTDRAGPEDNGIRGRLGRRLISIGQRLAYGRSQMVPR